MQQLSASQASPEVTINEAFETLGWAEVYGKNHPTTTGLIWGYYGGRWGECHHRRHGDAHKRGHELRRHAAQLWRRQHFDHHDQLG